MTVAERSRPRAEFWSFQHVNIGNPQCSIAIETEQELAALELGAIARS